MSRKYPFASLPGSGWPIAIPCEGQHPSVIKNRIQVAAYHHRKTHDPELDILLETAGDVILMSRAELRA